MTATSPRLSPSDFRRACAQFATGVAVLTTTDSTGSPHGLTVNSFTSVSAEPPLVLVCIDLKCSLLVHFRTSDYFAVNILAVDQQSLSERFAANIDARFDGVLWSSGSTGAPVLGGTCCSMECRVLERICAGDHVILIGEVVGADIAGGAPLLYYASGYRSLTP